MENIHHDSGQVWHEVEQAVETVQRYRIALGRRQEQQQIIVTLCVMHDTQRVEEAV